MDFGTFIDAISPYESWGYTHIMEFPKKFLGFAKTLNYDHWNEILKNKHAIALTCFDNDEVRIIFKNECYNLGLLPDGSIVSENEIILNKNNLSGILIEGPRDNKMSIHFSSSPFIKGKIEVFVAEVFEKEVSYEDLIQAQGNLRLEDNYDFVIDLRKNCCAQVCVDEENWPVYNHKYRYLIEHKKKFYFSTDLKDLMSTKDIINYSFEDKNIGFASFINDDLFYYTTRETFSDYSDYRCGLISISKGEILNNNRYTNINRIISNTCMVVTYYFYEHKSLVIRYGLADFQGTELLPADFSAIQTVFNSDGTIKIWVKREKEAKDWMIFELKSRTLRDALEDDYH